MNPELIVGGLVALGRLISDGDVFLGVLGVVVLVFVAGWLGRLPQTASADAPEPDVPHHSGLLERVRFDVTGFVYLGEQGDRLYWRSVAGDQLSLLCAPGRLGPTEGDPDVLSYCRDLIEYGSSLVEARPLFDEASRGLACIYKRDDRPGYEDAGRLHVFAEQETVIVFMAARDGGVTRIRAAFRQIEQSFVILPANHPARDGWPYGSHPPRVPSGTTIH
jgi:hypothetical protein